jgi:hypothetical protein
MQTLAGNARDPPLCAFSETWVSPCAGEALWPASVAVKLGRQRATLTNARGDQGATGLTSATPSNVPGSEGQIR